MEIIKAFAQSSAASLKNLKYDEYYIPPSNFVCGGIKTLSCKNCVKVGRFQKFNTSIQSQF